MSDTSILEAILARLTNIEKRQEDILREQRVLYRQFEALFALYHHINFRAPLLDLRGWAASPDLAAILATHIRHTKPATIFEVGGGHTTLISAYCLEQLGTGHVYALDHDKIFADRTRENLLRHGLTDYATVYHAPLKPYVINGKTWQWYDLDAVPEDLVIDLLLVDGPPQHAQLAEMVRYPTLSLLGPRLSPHATIIMDDTGRDDERRIAEAWLLEYPLTLVRDYDHAFGESEKGAKVFQMQR
jgi:predicted O-methyltransferase YrrM